MADDTPAPLDADGIIEAAITIAKASEAHAAALLDTAWALRLLVESRTAPSLPAPAQLH